MARTIRRAQDETRTVNFHGERRSNETHVAPHEPEAKLFRKGKSQRTKLYYMGHVLMDHRQGLVGGCGGDRSGRFC